MSNTTLRNTDSSVPKRTSPREAKKAVVASFLGGTLEYYDFFIYGSAAALIFTNVFFSAAGNLALLASFASFGMAYIARPLGAVVLGHFGDMLGRKRVMVWALAIMGTSTFIIGCLPDYNQIGMLAPILLVVMRLLQGFSAGGETAGASSLVLEHAPENRRGFFGSWIQSGIVTGFVLATLAFIPISALPEEQLLAWGWRVPFWLSAILLVVAYLVRRSLAEPEIFEEKKTEVQASSRLPITSLFRDHKADVFRLGGLTVYQAIYTMVMVYGLSFAVTSGGERTSILFILLLFNMVAIGITPVGGWLSDQFGRRPVFIAGAVGCVILAFPYFHAISTGSMVSIILIGLLMNGIAYPIGNGTTPAYFSELFKTNVRYSGTAIGIQLGMIVSGFSPSITTSLVGQDSGKWWIVASVIVTLGVIAVIASLSTKETAKTSTRELGL